MLAVERQAMRGGVGGMLLWGVSCRGKEDHYTDFRV